MKLTVIAIALLAAASTASAQEHSAHADASQPTTGTSTGAKDQSMPGMDMSNAQEATTNKSPSAQAAAAAPPASNSDTAPMQHDGAHQMPGSQMTPEQKIG